MHFYNLMQELASSEKVELFVDMDGVIASYDFGKPLNFKAKRPLNSNIKTLKAVSNIENINLNILSVCRKDSQILEKNEWLDRYAPFFKKENRFILSKESIPDMSSPLLKLNFLKNYSTNKKMVLLDDDNNVLSTISKEQINVILLQDSELID